MKYNVAILGLGALGKGHLSSILNSKLAMDIYCYDINECAMEGFCWDNKFANKKINIINTLMHLPEKIDFALFAMTSNSRREMFDKVISCCEVKNILFEKVLFQSVGDYTHVRDTIKNLGINAWVNCSRRQMESYQSLKKELAGATEMQISISGGEWGLACNVIHELDIIEFLSGSDATVVNKMELLPVIVDSKRKGFKEIFGTISGNSGKKCMFSITCMKDTQVPLVMTISTDIGQYIIFESEQKMIFLTKVNDYEMREVDFVIPYQSQMTQFVIEDILLRHKSRLTEFEDSSRLHLKIIKPFLQFFRENGMETELCPIT